VKEIERYSKSSYVYVAVPWKMDPNILRCLTYEDRRVHPKPKIQLFCSNGYGGWLTPAKMQAPPTSYHGRRTLRFTKIALVLDYLCWSALCSRSCDSTALGSDKPSCRFKLPEKIRMR
jgi:hypothetical protein